MNGLATRQQCAVSFAFLCVIVTSLLNGSCIALSQEVGVTKEQQASPSEQRQAEQQDFRDDQFGIFIHWGVYSGLERGEWVMHNEKMTVDQYKKYAKQFNPVKYDPAEWVSLFKRAGAKYVTITSKHHDGFALWDSDVTDWNVVDATPYGQDLLKPLAKECEKQGLKLFFYHSHLDWTHPDYYPRGKTGRHSGRPKSGDFSKYLDFMDAQLTELLGGEYGKIAGIWFDGWWDQKSKKLPENKENQGNFDPKETQIDWRLGQTYGLIHRLQPTCLIGNNHHVAPFPGEDFQMFERDLPGQNTTGFSEDSVIGSLPLETCDTINGSWGYNVHDKKFKTPKQLVHYLVRAAGQNANLLLNVGPRPDGTIQEEFAERLEAIGKWLDQFGKTVYASEAGPCPPQDWGVTTKSGGTIYLHLLDPPPPNDEGWIELPGTGKLQAESLRHFDSGESVEFEKVPSGNFNILLPKGDQHPIDTILVVDS